MPERPRTPIKALPLDEQVDRYNAAIAKSQRIVDERTNNVQPGNSPEEVILYAYRVDKEETARRLREQAIPELQWRRFEALEQTRTNSSTRQRRS